MKRKGLLALAVAASLALAGCDSAEMGSRTLRAIHVVGLGEGAQCDFAIQGRSSARRGVEVKIDGVWCYFSDGTYVLISAPDKCPICDDLQEAGK